MTPDPIYLYPCWQRPNRDETIHFLLWMVLGAAALGKKAVIVIGDHASWHLARKVKRWMRRYHHHPKSLRQPHWMVWTLPKRSPWLNPIEPHGLHAKKRIVEPSDADRSPHLLRQRVFQALDAQFIASLSLPVL
jgi:hypothetical protein